MYLVFRFFPPFLTDGSARGIRAAVIKPSLFWEVFVVDRRHQGEVKGRKIWPCKKKFVNAMTQQLGESGGFESPLDLYQWFVDERPHPLDEERRRQAYLAAWAVFIDKGLVNL